MRGRRVRERDAGRHRRAGRVTATAIYNHFASREELLYAAGRRALDEPAVSLSPEEPDGTASPPSGSGAVRYIAARGTCVRT